MHQDLNWLISVDDHLFEPPDAWTSAAPARWRDRVPRVIAQDGVSVWAYEDVRTPVSGILVQAGRDRSQVNPDPLSYEEMLPAYYDAAARVEYMNRDGVLASLCFPFFPRFCGQTFYEASDRELAAWCVSRWNDWCIEEWAGSAPGRFLPLMILPLWDPRAAAEEIERCAAKGAKAISFSENPSRLGLPSLHDRGRYWDPVFAAAEETGLPLAIHFGSSSSIPTTSPDAPLLVTGALSPINLAFALTDWIFSGNLERHPGLRILMSEGGIGWIPYMIERCENIVETQEWAQRMDYSYDLGSGEGAVSDRGGTRLAVPPAELFRRHFYGCFIDDEYGCRHLEEIGVDNVMIETDFPHGDSSYPNSIERATEMLAGQTAETRYKVLQGNAAALFELGDPIAMIAAVRGSRAPGIDTTSAGPDTC